MKLLTDIRNYPQRSGTSQVQRYKADLMGDNVKLDERTNTDFILFVQRLSEQLTYYNLNNAKQGTWAGFLQNDITYYLAQAASGKADQWNKVWLELMENVEAPGGEALMDEDYQRYFTWRFSFLYTLVGKLMQAYACSSLMPVWRSDLQALFTSSHLMTLYFLLEKYYESSSALLLTDAGKFSYNDLSLSTKEMLATDLLQYGKETASLLEGSEPFLDNTDFIFGTAETVPEKVGAASEYLDEIATQLISLQNSVRLMASKYLSQTLDNFRIHQPHVGLLYAFIKLAEEHKNEINGLLLKHLDFYYKEVLLVKPKGWQPAQVFVAFELAKNVPDYFLPSGSLLQAGKDGKGKDVFYETLQDITVTNVEVTDIRSFTFLKNQSATAQNVRMPLGWFGRTVANSADGKGAKLAPGESWNAFSNNADNKQSIGIAFYSELLWQANEEGKIFDIYLKLSGNNNNYTRAATFITQCGSVKINTDKEPILFDLKAEATGGQLKISFTVSGIKNISKTSPNASLIFGNKLESVVASNMDVIEMFQTERIVNLQIFVSDFTVKVNKVETAAGVMDISSAFPAFGSSPKAGSNFTVFAPFLVHKKVSTPQLIIRWANKTERSFLVNSHLANNINVPGTVGNNVMDTTLPLSTGAEVDFGNNDEIKIELTSGNFGHDTYASDMTEAVLKYQSGTDDDDTDITYAEIGRRLRISEYLKQRKGGGKLFNPPQTPYTPMVKSLEIKGAFKEELLIAKNIYFQLPFGIKKVVDNAYLIPSFTLNAGSADAAEGELYIGLNNVSNDQVIRLLLAVEESSANPELQNPTVSWSYLKDDRWVKIDKAGLEDGTNNLIQSGIVSFKLPVVDVSKHMAMPAGLYWVKVAVPYGFTSAVASIISIQAQAVLAQFTNRNNEDEYLGKNIPANTVSNLFPKQSAIKKALQPFPSFGGQQKEADNKLYTRTSERLRHKSRGVTAWDFENIILEQFPDVYKVKVLHHACPHVGSSNTIEKIIAKSGNVLVLVLPRTHAQNGFYKPMVSKARLTQIFRFIQPLASPFIKLTVMNPLFETVDISMIAYFMPTVKDEAAYTQRLQDDVQRYLSPWAFDGASEPDFGGVIYRNTIVDFVESLPYIDYVEQLGFTAFTSGTSPESIKASLPASILISGSMNRIIGKVQTLVNQESNTPTIAFC